MPFAVPLFILDLLDPAINLLVWEHINDPEVISLPDHDIDGIIEPWKHKGCFTFDEEVNKADVFAFYVDKIIFVVLNIHKERSDVGDEGCGLVVEEFYVRVDLLVNLLSQLNPQLVRQLVLEIYDVLFPFLDLVFNHLFDLREEAVAYVVFLLYRVQNGQFPFEVSLRRVVGTQNRRERPGRKRKRNDS
jgi:hypothetical protein